VTRAGRRFTARPRDRQLPRCKCQWQVSTDAGGHVKQRLRATRHPALHEGLCRKQQPVIVRVFTKRRRNGPTTLRPRARECGSSAFGTSRSRTPTAISALKPAANAKLTALIQSPVRQAIRRSSASTADPASGLVLPRKRPHRI